MPVGSACWGSVRRVFCGSARGSAAIATAIRTSPRIRCAWHWAAPAKPCSREYLEQLNAIGAELSLSSELAAVSEPLAALAQAGGDLNAARADEPYRRAITGMYARLAATYQNLTGRIPPRPATVEALAYPDAASLRADLQILEDSLKSESRVGLNGGGALARLNRAVETFGFHLATLDLRQNADVHARVVAELLQGGGCIAGLSGPLGIRTRRAAAAGTGERTLAGEPVRQLFAGNHVGTRHRARRRAKRISATAPNASAST